MSKKPEQSAHQEGSTAKSDSKNRSDDFKGQIHGGDGDISQRSGSERPDRHVGSQDQGHPAMDDPLPGQTPHGDGTPRHKDGENEPQE